MDGVRFHGPCSIFCSEPATRRAGCYDNAFDNPRPKKAVGFRDTIEIHLIQPKGGRELWLALYKVITTAVVTGNTEEAEPNLTGPCYDPEIRRWDNSWSTLCDRLFQRSHEGSFPSLVRLLPLHEMASPVARSLEHELYRGVLIRQEVTLSHGRGLWAWGSCFPPISNKFPRSYARSWGRP